jgi:hypothetical protein
MVVDDVIAVADEAELRAILGDPIPRVAAKDRPSLSEDQVRWLTASPFCLVATSGADGSCDVSPKGDPPGFTLVLDEKTLVIPDRPGNRRGDGFRNVLANPHVGLIYLIPGRGDTLRVNGRATLVRDAPYFDDLVVSGHRPDLALVVDIQQVYFHCSKAFLRSKLWDPAAWNPDAVPSRAKIAKRMERPDDSIEELERYYGPSYAEKLYG